MMQPMAAMGILLVMLAFEIVEAVTSGKISAEAIVQQHVDRAKAVADINALITLCEQQALAKARAIDRRLEQGESLGALAGVPVVIKDNICTSGIRTTAGSQILADFVPPYSATVVERLEQADAIVIGKANLDEFGMGSSNEYSAFGAVNNPWDKSRVPGGSSGGSAAAVAAGIAPLALGTDTGGSVRLPASFTGVIGYKPTYGRLSRYGVIAYASSLDQVGILTRSSRDLALAMDAMSGHDPRDATSIEVGPSHFQAELGSASLVGLKVGVIDELVNAEGNSPEVRQVVESCIAQLKSLGASIQTISIPHVPYGIAAYYLVANAEASSNLARYDGMIYSRRTGELGEGQAEVMMRSRGAALGPEVRRRILTGTYALSAGYYDAYYGKALQVRRLIADDFARAFTQVDVLIAPTAPTPAYKLGEKLADPLAMYAVDICTVTANLVGLAALSAPLGMSQDGLPIGVQLMAPAMQDERLLSVVSVLEQQHGAGFAPLAPEPS
jgi:aspartyl-tRNA(Asn)/glutamyl-tRNA(Gln) amidotransferase subunit A